MKIIEGYGHHDDLKDFFINVLNAMYQIFLHKAKMIIKSVKITNNMCNHKLLLLNYVWS